MAANQSLHWISMENKKRKLLQGLHKLYSRYTYIAMNYEIDDEWPWNKNINVILLSINKRSRIFNILSHETHD